MTKCADRLRDCGHIFCLPCLQVYLRSYLARYVANQIFANPPKYEGYRESIQFLRAAQEYMTKYDVPAPRYRCPCCHAGILEKPREARELHTLLSKLKDGLRKAKTLLGQLTREDERELTEDLILEGCDMFFL